MHAKDQQKVSVASMCGPAVTSAVAKLGPFSSLASQETSCCVHHSRYSTIISNFLLNLKRYCYSISILCLQCQRRPGQLSSRAHTFYTPASHQCNGSQRTKSRREIPLGYRGHRGNSLPCRAGYCCPRYSTLVEASPRSFVVLQ